jgi:hypothetical protein
MRHIGVAHSACPDDYVTAFLPTCISADFSVIDRTIVPSPSLFLMTNIFSHISVLSGVLSSRLL